MWLHGTPGRLWLLNENLFRLFKSLSFKQYKRIFVMENGQYECCFMDNLEMGYKRFLTLSGIVFSTDE